MHASFPRDMYTSIPRKAYLEMVYGIYEESGLSSEDKAEKTPDEFEQAYHFLETETKRRKTWLKFWGLDNRATDLLLWRQLYKSMLTTDSPIEKNDFKNLYSVVSIVSEKASKGSALRKATCAIRLELENIAQADKIKIIKPKTPAKVAATQKSWFETVVTKVAGFFGYKLPERVILPRQLTLPSTSAVTNTARAEISATTANSLPENATNLGGYRNFMDMTTFANDLPLIMQLRSLRDPVRSSEDQAFEDSLASASTRRQPAPTAHTSVLADHNTDDPIPVHLQSAANSGDASTNPELADNIEDPTPFYHQNAANAGSTSNPELTV